MGIRENPNKRPIVCTEALLAKETIREVCIMKLKKDIYTLKEIEEILGVSQRTLYRYIKDGKLTAVKPGGQWRVERPELEAFIKGK